MKISLPPGSTISLDNLTDTPTTPSITILGHSIIEKGSDTTFFLVNGETLTHQRRTSGNRWYKDGVEILLFDRNLLEQYMAHTSIEVGLLLTDPDKVLRDSAEQYVRSK